MDVALKFGSYEFPATFYPASESGDSRVAVVEIPRRSGAILGEPVLKERTVQIRGMLFGDTPAQLREAVDALRAAISAGRQKLYLWDDRWTWAVKTAFGTDYDPTGFARYCNVAIDFLCEQPVWYAENESLDTFTGIAGGQQRFDHYVNVGGNVTTWPILEISIGTSGTLDILVYTELPQQPLELKCPVTAGEVLVVDCEMQTVVRKSDGADRMGYVTGSFWSMPPKDSLMVSVEQTPTKQYATQVAVRWRPRWY